MSIDFSQFNFHQVKPIQSVVRGAFPWRVWITNEHSINARFAAMSVVLDAHPACCITSNAGHSRPLLPPVYCATRSIASLAALGGSDCHSAERKTSIGIAAKV
ncbi:hypothetical protein A3K87_04230 [Variovorax paradoxus]|uniref:Uncharacterized protein n=1 Tax=Variovorax paradoxus TaxID=34073 RepID=A0AA91DH33_VARPD|nr:hypothetical protein A3K87_04230 [Variovorax paradoxus]